jgi:hypothetical protein
MKIPLLGFLLIGAVGWGCTTPASSNPDGASSPDVDDDAAGRAEAQSTEAGGSCSLPAGTTYTFSATAADRSELSAPNEYDYYHAFLPAKDPAQVNCKYFMPCSSSTVVTVPAIVAAIANADVQAALAQPKGMLFGTDPRPAGEVWSFNRSDGKGFILGSGDAPAGLRALKSLLDKATTDMLTSPACAALPKSGP